MFSRILSVRVYLLVYQTTARGSVYQSVLYFYGTVAEPAVADAVG